MLVSNFLLSQQAEDTEHLISDASETLGGMNLRYMAPQRYEAIDAPGPAHTADDVFMFGAVAIEVSRAPPIWCSVPELQQVLTDTKPWAEYDDIVELILAIQRGDHPQRPRGKCEERGLDDNLWRLIESCMAAERPNRPTMLEVVQLLHQDI